MTIDQLIIAIEELQSKENFINFIDNNFQEIEPLFYGKNFDELNTHKFDLEDLFLDLKDKNWLDTINSNTSINAFFILLADYFERFYLKVGISNILDHLPEGAVKKRIQAAHFYSKFNNINQYFASFNTIVELLNEAYQEEDFEYKIDVSLVNFYSEVLSHLIRQPISQVEEFKQLFLDQQTKYPFFNTPLINFALEILSAEKFNENLSLVKEQIKELELTSLQSLFQKVKTIDFEEECGEYADYINQLRTTDFDTIRSYASSHLSYEVANRLYSRLERGVKIIDDENLLFLYLYSFGKMHKAKLDNSFDIVSSDFPEEINLIDWGCGQALATFLLQDYINNKGLSIRFDDIILIEPSVLALKRGILHLKAQRDFNANVIPIPKDLDSLVISDIKFNNQKTIVNLFSNILDVPYFNLDVLANKIKSTQTGISYFICISPNISDIRNQRISSFYNYFASNYDTILISNRNTNIFLKNKSYTRFEKIFKVDFSKKK